ncbi:MAG: hypothetical protein PHR35_21415, partial [Kiritimatiellae bacterium]|nr:hypothetical protein [Kiritimatiellia bacterium]
MREIQSGPGPLPEGGRAELNRGPVTAVIVGAGHRSLGYAQLALRQPELLRIVGVADPDQGRRERAARVFGVPDAQCFGTAEELARTPRFADAA